MAIDPLKFVSNAEDDAGSVLPGIAGLAPLGIIGYTAFQGGRRNRPIKASDVIGSGKELGQFGRTIGEKLKAEVGLEKLTEEFMKTEEFDRMIQKSQERNAVVQTLLTSLSDPSIGLDPAQLSSFREQLLQIAEGATTDDDAQNLLKAAFQTIHESGSEPLQRRFASRLREFQQVANQLVPPKFEFKSGMTFNMIGHGNMQDSTYRQSLFGGGSNWRTDQAGQLGRRYDRLMGMLGNGAERRVEVFSAGTSMNDRGVYARVWSGDGPGRGRYQTTIALSTRLDPSSPANMIRMGENLQTGYASGRIYASARDALNLVKERGAGNVGLKALMRRSSGGFADHQLDMLEQELAAGGGRIRNRTKFNAMLRDTLEVSPRSLGPTNSALNSLDAMFPDYRGERRRQFMGAHNTLVLTGLERLSAEDKDLVMTGLLGTRSGGGVLDPGVGASRLMSDYIDGRQYGVLQLLQGSALENLRTGVAAGANRMSTPVVARLEQVTNRDMFWIKQRSQRSMPGVRLGAGKLWEAGGGTLPIEWKGGSLAGTTNKAVLLDVTMGQGRGAFAATEGWGQAYTTKRVGTLLNESVIPILDPKSTKMLSSELLETLYENQQAGRGFMNFEVRFDKKAKRTRLFHGGKSYDPFLGEGPAGSRRVHIDPRAKNIWLNIGEMIDANDKKQLQVIALQERDMDMAKLFGTLHKGTVVSVDQNVLMQNLGQYGVTTDFLKSLNIPTEHLLAGSGDMLKKAPDFLNVQMLSGLGMVGADLGGLDPFAYAARRTSADVGFGGGTTGRVADIVIDRLSKGIDANRISPEAAGRVLSGLYYASGLAQKDMGKNAAPGAFYGGEFAFKTDLLAKRMTEAFGTHYSAVLQTMKKGLALGAGSFAAGTGHGDYKLGRGSIEPRFMEFMGARLRDLGLNRSETAEFMASILKNKIGVQEGMAIVAPFENMVASQMNMLKGGPQAPILGIEDFQRIVTQGKFSEYLEKNKGGVYLDLTTGSGRRGAALTHAAKNKFGSANPLYFAGGGAMANMRGTEIKQGERTLRVGSEYARTVDQFADDVLRLSTTDSPQGNSAEEVFQLFKKDTARMYASSLFNLSRGKIKGSAMTMMQGYAIYSDQQVRQVGLDGNRLKAAKALSFNTRGQAVFMNDYGFLSMLKDYKGKDKGELLQKFFTSSEKAIHQARVGVEVKTQPGIISAVMRNPMLSYGNINIGQIYRDVQQVGRGYDDKTFSWLRMVNNQAVTDLETAVSKASGSRVRLGGFGDIAGLGNEHKKHVQKFFSQMAGSLKKWTAEGGGATYVPDMQFTVHFGVAQKQAVSTDFGFAGAAIGDFDGDWANTILLDKTQREKLLSNLKTKTSRKAYMEANATYIAQGSVYTKYGKQALKNKMVEAGASQQQAADELSRIAQDLRKESASKRVTGSLDVELNNIRRAVLSMKDADQTVVRETLALMKVLEEHTTIKSKKLPTYEPLGDETVSAVRRMFKEDNVTPLRALLEERIFPRAQFEELYSGFDIHMSPAGQKVDFVRGAHGANVSLDRVINFIGDAAANFNRMGGQNAATANILAANLVGDNVQDVQRVLSQVIAGEMSVQSGMAGAMGRDMAQQAAGVAGNAYQKVVAAAGKLDKRLAAGVTVGLGAGAAILGMAGIDGYDNTPLMMPGESPSAYVSQGASSYNLLEGQGRAEATGAMSDPYDMLSTPMNMGTTLVNRPSSYAIRGESDNMRGMGALSTYLNGIAGGRGTGSILINDTRRPLSSAFIDRAMGEY